MPSTSQQLDGQNVIVTVPVSESVSDLLTVNIVTGSVTSPWLNRIQTANLRKAALAFFKVVPLAERTSVAFLNRLVSVTAFEDWTVTLSAAATAPNEQTLRATIDVAATGDTHLAITLPHSITGYVANGGIGSGGGGGGGGGGTLLGDVTGPLLANTVQRIQGSPIDPFLAPDATNNRLSWDVGFGYWTAQSAAKGGAYDVSSFIEGFPAAGQQLMRVQGVRNARMTRIRLWVDDAPAADAAFYISGSTGIINFTLPAGNRAVVATGNLNWFDGGFLTLVAPAVQDIQMQNVNWTVEGLVL